MNGIRKIGFWYLITFSKGFDKYVNKFSWKTTTWWHFRLTVSMTFEFTLLALDAVDHLLEAVVTSGHFEYLRKTMRYHMTHRSGNCRSSRRPRDLKCRT